MGTARLSRLRRNLARLGRAGRRVVPETVQRFLPFWAQVTMATRRYDRPFSHTCSLRGGDHRQRIDHSRNAEDRACDAAHHSTRKVLRPVPSACPLYSSGNPGTSTEVAIMSGSRRHRAPESGSGFRRSVVLRFRKNGGETSRHRAGEARRPGPSPGEWEGSMISIRHGNFKTGRGGRRLHSLLKGARNR
jgi:hypothetical protein